jgi:phospholipid-binding lipoprotein MlaA
VKKRWSAGAVIVFFIVLFSYNPVDAFNDEVTLYLAQVTEESADKQTEVPAGQILDQAEEDEEDEYDDEYEYEDEDEYADVEDVELISDLWIEMNQGLYVFNDKMYFWVLKPVARGYRFIIPEELRQAIRNAYVQNRNKLIAE